MKYSYKINPSGGGISGDNAHARLKDWSKSEASRITEILRTVFKPRALPASRKEVYLVYNPAINF